MPSIPYKAERTPLSENRGSSIENKLPSTPPRKAGKRRSTIIAKLPLPSPSPPRKSRPTSGLIRSSKSSPSLVDPPNGPLPPLPPGAGHAIDPKIVFEKERFLNRHSRDFGYLHEAIPTSSLDADEAEAERERLRVEKLRSEGREKRRSLILNGGIPGLTSPTSPDVDRLSPTIPQRPGHVRRRPLSLLGSRASYAYSDSFGESGSAGSSSAPPHVRQFSLSSDHSSSAYVTAPEDQHRTPKASRRPLSLISLTPPQSRSSGISSSSGHTTSRGGCSDFSGESSDLRFASRYLSSKQATTEEEQDMMRRRAIAIARTSRRLDGVSTTNGDGRKWEDNEVNERAKSLYRESDDLGLGLGALPPMPTSAQDPYANPKRFSYAHQRGPSSGSYPLGANNTSHTRKRYSQVRREADARRTSDTMTVETYRSSGSSASIATSGGIARGRELLLVAAAGLREQYDAAALEERQETLAALPHPRGALRDPKSSEASTASVPFSVDGPSPTRHWALAQSSGANAKTLRRVKRLEAPADDHGIRISLFSSASEASHHGLVRGLPPLEVQEEREDVLSPTDSLQSSSPGSEETEVWRGMTSTELGRRLFWGADDTEEHTRSLSRVNTLRNVKNDVGLGLGISTSSSFTAAIASSTTIAQAAAKAPLLASPRLDSPLRSPIAPAPLGTLIHDGTDGASPGRPVRQTHGWADGVKGWLRGTKDKEAGEGEIERGFGDGRVGEQGERTPMKKRQKGWKSSVGVDHADLTLSPSKKRRSSVPDLIVARNSSASASTTTIHTLPVAARHVSNPDSIPDTSNLTPPPNPHFRTPYSPSSASSSSPLTPRFIETLLPRSQILHQPSTTSMRSITPFVPPSISSPSQFAVHFAGAHSYSPTAQTEDTVSPRIHSPVTPNWSEPDQGQETTGQVLTIDQAEARVPKMSPPPLGKRSKHSLEQASLAGLPTGVVREEIRVQRLAVPSPSFVGLGHRKSFVKYDFLKEDPQAFTAQTLPKARLRALPSPIYLDPRSSSSLPNSPNPDFGGEYATSPPSSSSTAHSPSFPEEQAFLPPSILRKRLNDSFAADGLPDIRPTMGIRTGSHKSVASSRSSCVETVESLDQVIPATVLFVIGFFLGPWCWLIGGWSLSPSGFVATSASTASLPWGPARAPRSIYHSAGNASRSAARHYLPPLTRDNPNKWVSRNRWAAIISGAIWIPACIAAFVVVGAVL